MDEAPDSQIGDVLEAVEQAIVTFYEQPLVVVRLPNGEPGVVLRSFCENLKLDLTGQLNRIRRKKALEKGLQYVRIESAGGPQVTAVLTLRVLPGWLFGIDAGRVKVEMRTEIERYQDECMDVLYQWASKPRMEKTADLVSSEPVSKPATPKQGASPQEWLAYHQQMTEFLDWQIAVEAWRGSVEVRLGTIEALIPDILERLPDKTITLAHQNMVKYYVSQLNKATNKAPATIYSTLYTAFRVPRYQELPESEWNKVEQWFKRQMPSQKLPSTQNNLFDLLEKE